MSETREVAMEMADELEHIRERASRLTPLNDAKAMEKLGRFVWNMDFLADTRAGASLRGTRRPVEEND